MNRFEELQAFVAVVDYQSFSKAGDKLGIAKSMLSRRVSELEGRLGVQLLQRTTRRQALTEAGRDFYRRAQQIIADMNEAEQIAADEECRLSGRIKLALPLSLGVSELAEPISLFMQAHPDISIDIDLNDRQVDLIEENVDLAIRVGELEDSTLIARRLAQVHFLTCASPGYLQKYGEPAHPEELSGHEVLVYSNVAVGRQWSYQQDGKRVSPRMRYRMKANNGEFLAAVARRDLAIVSGPAAYLQAYVERGELLPILRDCPTMKAGMYAVFPPGRLVSRRVRALGDALYEHFRERSI